MRNKNIINWYPTIFSQEVWSLSMQINTVIINVDMKIVITWSRILIKEVFAQLSGLIIILKENNMCWIMQKKNIISIMIIKSKIFDTFNMLRYWSKYCMYFPKNFNVNEKVFNDPYQFNLMAKALNK